MIEENIWYNGSRKKLEFNKFSGLFFLTTNKQLAVDYIDDGETCNGYLNTIDISKIKPYIFDYRTDFDKIKGMEFKSVWTNKIIVIDNNFKKLLARDWNKWSRTQPFAREHFVNLILKPAGFKGYYNTETDHGVKYPAIAIFTDYLDELKVLNSKKIELENSDEYIEESFDMNLNKAKTILENNGYTILEKTVNKAKTFVSFKDLLTQTISKYYDIIDEEDTQERHAYTVFVCRKPGSEEIVKFTWKRTGLYDENDNQVGYAIEDIDDALKAYCVFGESVNEAMVKQNEDGTYDVDLDAEFGDKPSQRVFNFKKPVDANAEAKMNEIVDKMEEKGFIFIGVTPSKTEYYYGHLDFKYVERGIPVYTSIFLGWVPEGAKDDYYFAIDTDVPRSVISIYCGKTTNSKHVKTSDEIVKSASIATKSTITVTLRELAWKNNKNYV